ncbi:hypothetical protein ACWEVT_43015, partial [Saccharopolyspora sp. NPDC003762]
MNTTKQIGGAFGLAALMSISGTQDPQAPVDYATAFQASAGILVAAGSATSAPRRPPLNGAEPGHEGELGVFARKRQVPCGWATVSREN